MPIYDYKCEQCQIVTESIQTSSVDVIKCLACSLDDPKVITRHGIGLAYRQLSAPGGISVNGKMVLSEQQMRKITEPVWQYPDGHIESAC